MRGEKYPTQDSTTIRYAIEQHSPCDSLFPERNHHPQQELHMLMHTSLLPLSIVLGNPQSIFHLRDSAYAQKWNDTRCPLLSDLVHTVYCFQNLCCGIYQQFIF